MLLLFLASRDRGRRQTADKASNPEPGLRVEHHWLKESSAIGTNDSHYAVEPFMEEPRNHQQRNTAVQPMWRTAAAPGQLGQPMQRQDRMCY
ncbi:unnamed protein product [Arctogadus glacialis]